MSHDAGARPAMLTDHDAHRINGAETTALRLLSVFMWALAMCLGGPRRSRIARNLLEQMVLLRLLLVGERPSHREDRPG